jgi:hypothetical protein
MDSLLSSGTESSEWIDQREAEGRGRQTAANDNNSPAHEFG